MKRGLKLRFIISIICLTVLSVSPFVLQGATIGKGRAKIFNNNEGSARDQALRNALRDAVKQGVGVLLDSQTVVKNWAVIRDEVYSSARGFVTKYSVLKDEKQNDVWYIEIDAEVSTADIKDKLADLRILHKKMGNKRLMVIYRPDHPDALDAKHGAVLAALTSIPDELNKSGFRVFDQRSLGHVISKITQSGGSTEAWRRIADQNQVDILVEFELIAGKKKPFSRSAFSSAKTVVRLRVYDVSTGRLISNTQSEQKQMTNARVGSYDWDNALTKAGSKAGRMATAEGIKNIVSFYQSVGDIGNSFLIVFKDFSEDEGDIILELLENLDGYQSLSELENIPQLLRVEYFSTIEKSRLRRKIRLAAKEKKIRIRTKRLSGNRLIFLKQ